MALLSVCAAEAEDFRRSGFIISLALCTVCNIPCIRLSWSKVASQAFTFGRRHFSIIFRSETDSHFEALKRAYQTNAFRTHIACLTTYGISLKVSHQISILNRTTVKHPFNAMLSTTAENNKEGGRNVGVAALWPPPTKIPFEGSLGRPTGSEVEKRS